MHGLLILTPLPSRALAEEGNPLRKERAIFYEAGAVSGPPLAMEVLVTEGICMPALSVVPVDVFIGTTQFPDKGYALSGQPSVPHPNPKGAPCSVLPSAGILFS